MASSLVRRQLSGALISTQRGEFIGVFAPAEFLRCFEQRSWLPWFASALADVAELGQVGCGG